MATLILDTTSIINLSKIRFRRKPVTHILDRCFEIVITTDGHAELLRNKHKLDGQKVFVPFFQSRKTTFYRQRLYENAIRNQFAPNANPAKNRGERLSLGYCLHKTRVQKEAMHIFLTDDFKAIKGLGDWFEERFPITRMWNSLDLLLFLYLVGNGKWSMTEAKDALRTLNALMGGNDAAVRLVNYHKRLQRLDQSMKQLP